jgi:hypothetical protein
MSHPWASLMMMAVVTNTIYSSEALLIYTNSGQQVTRELRAIRHALVSAVYRRCSNAWSLLNSDLSVTNRVMQVCSRGTY